MIGTLPKHIEVGGENRAIRTDFRVALTIFVVYNDVTLSDTERVAITLQCLYVDIASIQERHLRQAIEQAVIYLDGNREQSEKTQQTKNKLLDWEQDESYIFSAINKVAGREVRDTEYLHWWTFLGYMNEMGEGVLSSIINIRNKKATGKKLEKHEREYYSKNKSMIDIKVKYTDEEQAEINRLNKLLG